MRVRLNTGSLVYAKNIRKLLRIFEIESRITSDPRRNGRLYYLEITKRTDIELYAKNINFRHREKKEKIAKLIKGYKRFSMGVMREKIFEKIKENPKINETELTKIFKLTNSTISTHVIKLIKEKRIKVEKDGQKKLLFI